MAEPSRIIMPERPREYWGWVAVAVVAIVVGAILYAKPTLFRRVPVFPAPPFTAAQVLTGEVVELEESGTRIRVTIQENGGQAWWVVVEDTPLYQQATGPAPDGEAVVTPATADDFRVGKKVWLEFWKLGNAPDVIIPFTVTILR